MSQKTVTIKARQTGAILARGSEPQDVFRFEGNWYFLPDVVNSGALKITKRTYTCPYKGTCFWVDFEGDGQRAQSIAWVYTDPKPGYEQIKGKYGFYAGSRPGTIEE